MITRREFAGLVAALIVAPWRKLVPARPMLAFYFPRVRWSNKDTANLGETSLLVQVGGTFLFAASEHERLGKLHGIAGTIDEVLPDGDIIFTLRNDLRGNDGRTEFEV